MVANTLLVRWHSSRADEFGNQIAAVGRRARGEMQLTVALIINRTIQQVMIWISSVCNNMTIDRIVQHSLEHLIYVYDTSSTDRDQRDPLFLYSPTTKA